MFKITNNQLIQMAAVDLGLDPFAEYCTKGVYAANGYKVRTGEKPVLTLDLWCPRVSKDSATGEAQESSEPQQGEKLPGMFFMFKKCNLFTRSQVQSSEELAAEKEAKRFAKAQAKSFKQTVKSMGGIAPDQDYSIPQWARNSQGLPLDVAVDEISAAGFICQDSESLFSMLVAM